MNDVREKPVGTPPYISITYTASQSYIHQTPLVHDSPGSIEDLVLQTAPLPFFFHLTHSRWTSSLPSCLWSQRIFPSLPGSRLTIFYRDTSSALLQLVNQWLNFTYSRSHAFRYERKKTNPTLVRIEPVK